MRDPRLRGVKWGDVAPLHAPVSCGCNADPDEHCPVHVRCDLGCRALREPGRDVQELRRALEHWRDHACDYGCSHGH